MIVYAKAVENKPTEQMLLWVDAGVLFFTE